MSDGERLDLGQIDIWGTFEVANLGDLLMPLTLEHELRRRGSVTSELVLRSPVGGTMPLGESRSVHRIPSYHDPEFRTIATHGPRAIVFGGGDLLRLDPHPAGSLLPGAEGWYRYDPFLAELSVLATSRPVVWNGVGVPYPLVRSVRETVRALARDSAMVSVRDEMSKSHLIDAGVDVEIHVVPDPALVADRWLRDRIAGSTQPDGGLGSHDATSPRPAAQGAGATDGFEHLAFHVSFTSASQDLELIRGLEELLVARPALRITLVPLGLCHGDGPRLERIADALGPRSSTIPAEEASIASLVGAIADADALVSSSLHANLLASRFGVPSALISVQTPPPHKLVEAARLLGREQEIVDHPARLVGIAARLLEGSAPQDPVIDKGLEADVDLHYDRIATALTDGARPRSTLSEHEASERVATAAAAVDSLVARQTIEMTGRWSEAIEAHRLAAVLAHELEIRIAHVEQDRAGLQARVDDLEARVKLMQDERTWLRSSLEQTLPGAIAGFSLGLEPATAPPVPADRILRIERLRASALATEPYQWGEIDGLFRPDDARALVATYPIEPFKTVVGDDGEKGYEYEVRSLVAMGRTSAAHPDQLSEAWRQLTDDLCSPDYRAAMSALTGRDLADVPIEVNLFHYGAGGHQGPHADLADKLVTHVLYFNEDWPARDGGCFRVLASQRPDDVVAEIVPTVASSVVIVRSHRSWHAVTPVAGSAATTRRSVTVTFYRPGSGSTMWPPHETPALHRFPGPT